MLLEPWRIELFGGLKLRQGDRLIARFPTQKVASLLAYLALHADRVHPREQLADLLWPDADVDSARHNLRQALLSLRRLLEPPETPPNSVLVADRASVRLGPAAVEVDAGRFTALLQSAEDSKDESERLRYLADACAQYGGPLLPGVYEEWADSERERFAVNYRRALVSLSRAQTESGDHAGSIESLRRAAAVDSLDSETREALIRRLAEAGRPTEAVKEMESARRVWRKELDEDLPEGLLELARKLPQVSAARSVQPASQRRSSVAVSAPPDQEPRVRLPLPLTRFFGRQEEIARIQATLESESGARLLTLTGPGGAGKSRTAVEAARVLARGFGSAVWFVPLADIASAALIPESVLSSMGLELAGGRALEQLIRVLGSRPTLLVMDNLEHLLDGGPELLQQILQGAPKVRMIATSRQPLGIAGEQELPLAPLATPGQPGTPQRLLEFPSVEMFCDRAQHVKPDFQITGNNAEAVAALCSRLEGIPLAIELAAARASVLTPAQMLGELKDRFAFLTSRSRAVPDRHRTLRAVLDSSVEALEERLKRTFARLSVFRGGYTLDAAHEICDNENVVEALHELRNRSLVSAEERGGQMRYSMLETIREYAQSSLDDEDVVPLHRTHATHFAGLALQFWESANLMQETDIARKVADDHDNIRASLAWALENDPSVAVDVCAYLQRFWYVRGYLEEGQRWTESALERTESVDSPNRARALNSAGVMARDRGSLSAAQRHCRHALEMALRLEETRIAAIARHNLGLIAVDLGNYAEAIDHAETTLAELRAIGLPGSEALTLNLLGHAHLEMGRLDAAISYSEEALEAARSRDHPWTICTILNGLGTALGLEGRREEASAALEESLRIARHIDNRRGIALAQYNLGMLGLRAGDVESVPSRLFEALSVLDSIGDQGGVTFTIEALAYWLTTSGRYFDAAKTLGASDHYRATLPAPRPPVEHPDYEKALDALRSALGEAKLRSLLAEGSRLTLPQAVEMARDSTSPILQPR